MISCTFRLNGGKMSTLSCPGLGFFLAYSGNAGPNRNNPDAANIKNVDPLPPGRYYIVSREPGPFGSRLKTFAKSMASGSDHTVWFALYRDDNKIDDITFYKNTERGNFRLHPAGWRGISNGCITLPNVDDYMTLYRALLSTTTMRISSFTAFGTIQVY